MYVKLCKLSSWISDLDKLSEIYRILEHVRTIFYFNDDCWTLVRSLCTTIHYRLPIFMALCACTYRYTTLSRRHFLPEQRTNKNKRTARAKRTKRVVAYEYIYQHVCICRMISSQHIRMFASLFVYVHVIYIFCILPKRATSRNQFHGAAGAVKRNLNTAQAEFVCVIVMYCAF